MIEGQYGGHGAGYAASCGRRRVVDCAGRLDPLGYPVQLRGRFSRQYLVR